MATKDFFLWIIIYAVGGAGATIGFYLIRRYFTNRSNRHDSIKIINFMEKQLNKSTMFSLTSGQIANGTNLTEERVKELCSKHENIESIATDSWGLRYFV